MHHPPPFFGQYHTSLILPNTLTSSSPNHHYITFTVSTTPYEILSSYSTYAAALNIVNLPVLTYILPPLPNPFPPTSPSSPKLALFLPSVAAPNTNANTVEFNRHTTLVIPAPTAGSYSSDTPSAAPHSALHPALN